MKPALPTLEDKVRFLSDPRTHGVRPGDVRSVETHFAWVFLAEANAYKLKKPLRHKQMDYRTLASRERGCRAELMLNRRFARGIYRSLVPLTGVDGRLSLGGRGQVVDWLLRMRRLPDERMLDHALEARSVDTREIRHVARVLARQYRHAEKHPMRAAVYIARFRRQVSENRRVIRRYGRRLPQTLAQEVFELQLDTLEHLGPALGARGASVVDGHGDLRAEHVYLGPPIAFIDSLEFDAALRLMDPAEELALLALEIERLGWPGLADALVGEFCGTMRVPPAAPVLSFYKSHRAATRAKLAAWHLDDPQFPDPKPWVARTRSLLGDALRHARAARKGVELRPALATTRRRRAATVRAAARAEHRRPYG